MTVAAGPVPAGRRHPPRPPRVRPAPLDAPRLADGVELLGEYKDSGYSQPPSLVRRADGQVIQMSRPCCTWWPAGSTAPATRPPSRSWPAPTSAGP